MSIAKEPIPDFYRRVPEIKSRDDLALRRKLHEIWKSKPGIAGFLSDVDHKHLGIRYIVTAFCFLTAAGILALIMRLQLAGPNARILTPEQYDEIFTMHGGTMIIWYAFFVLTGFGHYLWPLIFGSRAMAFPRLEAFSWWVYLASGLFLYSSFAVEAAPNGGWFSYVPYVSKQYDPGINIDFYCLAIIFMSISVSTASINFLVTTLRARCPGMSINRWPVLAWGTLTTNTAGLFVMPVISLVYFMLWLDRNFGFQFFTTQGYTLAGKPLLYQHLFWMWGHPWVYMLVLPAQGIVSDTIPTFCRRPLVGYTAVVLATVSTMMLGFGVWVHHMFATGLPHLALAYFSATSLIVTIPTGVQVFAWIATIWTGRPVFKTPMLFIAGFIFEITIGGVSGVMTAVTPVDWQLTDTYWVVAHIHYVLIGINFFGVMVGIHYWFPKFTGKMMSETLGKISFWLIFVGFNIGFFTMHITGLLGMPRRIYTYPQGLGLSIPNMITTIGAYILAVGILVFFINVFYSLRRGEEAGPNPWDAYSLEWSVPSPPPPYNFAVIPSVASRHPLWESRLSEGEGHSVLSHGIPLDDEHEHLLVSAVDGEPQLIEKMPGDSYAPFLMTLCLSGFFAGLLVHFWSFAAASVVVGIFVGIYWLWPRREEGVRALGAVRR